MRARYKVYALQSILKKSRIQRHVTRLSCTEKNFNSFPNVAVIFQTFNKEHMIRKVLHPFLKSGFKNIVIFADGCADRTLQTASRMLQGRNHIVIGTNNLHEITTYSIASYLSPYLDADYLLLAQDDDIYPDDFSWLTAAIELMRTDLHIATIGFNGGYDFSAPIADSDPDFATAQHRSKESDGISVAELLPYFSIVSKKLSFSQNSYSYDYVDIIDRAPQLIRLAFLREAGGFPSNFAPYNYDDIFLCLAAWRRGYKVVHMPIRSVVRNVGIGGMRLFKTLMTNGRPAHLGRNWHYIYEEYSNFINSGELRREVEKAHSQEFSRGKKGNAFA